MADADQGHSWRIELTTAAARARLFLSSYVPLFIILAIRFDDRKISAACAILAVGGALDTTAIVWRVRRAVMPHLVIIGDAEDVGGEVAGYLATYLLPFVTVASPTVRDLAGYVLYMLVALAVYVRSDLVRVNPTLYVFAYRVWRVTTANGLRTYLIARVQPATGSPIFVTDVAGVLIEAHRAADT